MFDICNLKGQEQSDIYFCLLFCISFCSLSLMEIESGWILRHQAFQVGFPLKFKCALKKRWVGPGKSIHLTHYALYISLVFLDKKIHPQIVCTLS